MEKEKQIHFQLHRTSRLIKRYLDNSHTKSYIDNVTGNHGYIIGYIPCAVIIALLVGKFENKKFVYPLSMVLGVAVCYAAGTAWYVFQTKTAVAAAFATCVIPFIPADCIKIAAASLLGIILRKRFRVAFSKL